MSNREIDRILFEADNNDEDYSFNSEPEYVYQEPSDSNNLGE